MQLILENIIFELQRAGGISVYWAELISRLNEKHSKGLFFFGEPNSNIFRNDLTGLIEVAESSFVPRSLKRYLPFLRVVNGKAVFHSSYYRLSLQRNVANITTVHDFTYEYYVGGLQRFIHSAQKKYAVKYSEGIICVSENTKRDLIKFVPGVDKENIKVIYNGVSEDFKKLADPSIKLELGFPELVNKPFVLFVGDRSPYKNFDKVVSALASFPEYQLVVVGGKDFSDSEKAILKKLKGRYFHYRGISSNALNVLYNSAFCLLYPSEYEGFGIPIVEAMRAGCPVISTNKSSIPEVAGNAGLLVNETSVECFVEQVVKLEDPKFRLSLIDKGFIQSAKFSWDKCFDETYGFYQEVYKKKFG